MRGFSARVNISRGFLRAVAAAIFLVAAYLLLRGGPAQTLHGAERAGGRGRGCPAGLVLVPSGEFFMGITEQMAGYLGKLCSRYMGACQEDWFMVEIPRRRVRVNSFCINEYEAPSGNGARPFTGATWTEAQKFCGGRGLRLCAEEEWEKACAGAEGQTWGFGQKFKLNACNIAGEGVSRAGAFGKCESPYGAFDMNGNVAEWVADEVDVEAGVNRTRKMRVVKGGSAGELSFFSRCSSREFYAENYRSEYIGFRCCSDVVR